MQNTLEFMKLLHPSLQAGELIELRSWGPDKKTPTTFFSSDYSELVEWVVSQYQTRNVFVGVCPRSAASGTNENIARAYWLWADLDSEKLKKGGNNLENYITSHFALPPTMLVASHGDKGGLHAYWAIESTTDFSTVVALNDAIAAKLNSDPVSDLPRILRVVGSLNHKYKPPIPVHLVKHREVVYTLADVTAALELPDKFSKLVYSGSTDGFTSRSERDFSAIGAMIRAGYSDDLIKTVFTNSRIGDKFLEPDGDHYMEQTLNKLRQSEQPMSVNKWGIIEKDSCYWRIMADGSMSQLSTFVFEPAVLLEGDTKHGEEDTLLGTMVAGGASWSDVALGKKAFADNAGMAKSLPRASWQWLGKDSDVRRLLPYLLDKLKAANNGNAPTKVKTAILGRHDNLFVLDGQVISGDGIIDPNFAPITWLPSGKELPSIYYEPVTYEVFQQELAQFAQVALNINVREVVLIALGYVVASLYKPVLNEQGVHFPVLNLFGTRGAGKTTLITDLLQRLMGYRTPRTYDSNTTRFVMLSLLGCSNAVPISFSEFRAASMRDADQLPGYIRLAYDSGHDSRGRSDQSMVDYPLSAPFTIDGEDAISDPACLERTIQLNLHPETIVEGSTAYVNMQALQHINLNAIGFELVKFTLNYQIDFWSAYERMRELYASQLPDRVRRNFAVVLAGIKVFQEFLLVHGFELDIPDEEKLFHEAIRNVVNIDTGRTVLPVDEMVTDMILFVDHNEGLKQFVFKYDPETMCMAFNLTSVYHWWARQRRQEGKNVLDISAIKQQLKERMAKDESQKIGDYVTGRKNVNVEGQTHYMYVVSLPAARQAGLDVPDLIKKIKPKITRVLEKANDDKQKSNQQRDGSKNSS